MGIGTGKLDEFFTSVGLISPTVRNLSMMRERLKIEIKQTSEATLQSNRREHVRTVRASKDYLGDVVATVGGKKYNVARGAAATDGAGATRAYNHLIRGSQHCLVVYSLVIKKPLVVLGHQISCWKCSHALTELITTEQLKMHDVQFAQVKHKGKCYRNTTHGPAVAEEYACVDAAEALLFNKDGKFLGEEEACFIDQLVTDGDTRGCKKFIEKQSELLGALVRGIAEHIPDIGHFIKTISNGFF